MTDDEWAGWNFTAIRNGVSADRRSSASPLSGVFWKLTPNYTLAATCTNRPANMFLCSQVFQRWLSPVGLH